MQQQPGKLRRGDDAYELALKALSHKERTESELRTWLAERGVEEAEIEEVLALLAEAGAVDDESFASRYAEDKRTLAGWGPNRIAAALAGHGIAREHIDAALAGDDEERQLERAVALLRDRELPCATEEERDRALRLLVRRGYSLEIGYEAVRAAERESREAA
jgi:regulatory protein